MELSRTPDRRSLGVGSTLLLGALVYVVCVGGPGGGELNPALRVFTAVIGGWVIVGLAIGGPRHSDRVDSMVVGALVFFALAGVMSQFPRQSFDAVLAATAYLAAFILARGYLGATAPRRMLEHVLIGLSVFFTLTAAIGWFPDVIRLWAVSDWEVVPPLNLELTAGGWGHRYDVVLMIAILYPAWWAGQPSRLRMAAAVPIGILGMIAIILTGSRTLWLAFGVATAVVGYPMLARLWRTYPAVRWTVGVGLVVGIAMTFAVGGPLFDRVMNINSLAPRLSLWGPLTQVWLVNPIGGVGPGSFPWALQLTPYFETSSYAPRHPDSVFFQLLAEGGILGMAALALVVAAVVPAVWNGRSSAARWVLVMCIVASLAANPTDFPFIVAVMLAWAAYAAPRQPSRDEPERRRHRVRMRAATVAALVIIAAAQSSTLLGVVAYDSARLAVDGGDVGRGIEHLDMAVALDPGMALYWRQRGTGHLVLGHGDRALADLTTANRLNPWDDLAWRATALAHAAEGDSAAALTSVDKGRAVQRSDSANLLLAAWLNAAADRIETSTEILAEVVQSWPSVTGAVGWSELAGQSGGSEALIEAAVSRWSRGERSPEPLLHQDLWLAALSGSASTPDSRALSAALADAVIASLRCDDNTRNLLAATSASDQRTATYWATRVRDAANRGTDDDAALEALLIYSGDAPLSSVEGTLNPLNEGFWWGYRRFPIFWPQTAIELPDWRAGVSRWMLAPWDAVAEAGLDAELPDCLVTRP